MKSRKLILKRRLRRRRNGTPPSGDQHERIAFMSDTGADDIGFQQARDSNADPHVLRTTLTAFEGDLRQEPAPSERKYWQNDIAKLKKNTAQAEAQAAETQGQMDAKVEENDQIEAEIEAKRTSDKKDERPVSTILFAGTGIVLFGAFCFVALFYASATYSAFFGNLLNEVKDGLLHDNTSLLFTSILRPGAVALAARQGLDTLATVLSFPFIIVSIGLLLHFIVEEHTLKLRAKGLLIAAVLTVALGFDYILARNISFQVWQVKRLTGIVASTETFSVYSNDFLSVLWLGFVSYAAFSLLLSFFLRIADRRRFIPYRRKKQEHNKRQIKRLKEKLLAINTTVKDYQAKVRYREELLDGKHRIWWFAEAETSKLVQAWCRFIESTRHDVKPRIAEARAVHERFLKDLRSTYTGTRNDADLGVIP